MPPVLLRTFLSIMCVPTKCRQTMSSADNVPTNEQERQIYNYVLENPSITTTQAATLLNIGQRRARNLLVKMVDDRWLNKEGASRSTVYVINHDPV